MNSTPDSYKAGLDYLEGLDQPAMENWLREELEGKAHYLAGHSDDMPVQAITNHYLYLSLAAQNRLVRALDAIINSWKEDLESKISGERPMLMLAAEVGRETTKHTLQSFTKSPRWIKVTNSLRAEVLRTIAGLSTNNDRPFWSALPDRNPEFAGMAFQALVRIAPNDAFSLLDKLPVEKPAVESVARKLPDAISCVEPEKQYDRLQQVADAIQHLPPELKRTLSDALAEEGFELPRRANEYASEKQIAFRSKMLELTQHVKDMSQLEAIYES